MESNGVWIRVQFNTNNQYDGADELVSELKQICPVQSSTKWHPAACTGLEMDLTLNFNLTLSAFLNNVVIPGAEFAGVCAAAKAIWKCFDKFYKKNEAIDIQEFNLNFDDVTILFKDVMSYSALQRFYEELPEHLNYLAKEGVKNISEIKLPYIEVIDDETGKIKYRSWSLEDGDDEELLWKIDYERGLEKFYYNPRRKEIVT